MDTSKRTARLDAVKAALLIGAQKHFPGVKEAALSDDAMIDLFEMGILDEPDEAFEKFLVSLRDPPPPEPVDD